MFQRATRWMMMLLLAGGPLGAGLLLFVIILVASGRIAEPGNGIWEYVQSNCPTIIAIGSSLVFGPVNATLQIQAKDATWVWQSPDPEHRKIWRNQVLVAYALAPMFTISNLVGVYIAGTYVDHHGGGGTAHTAVYTLLVNPTNLAVTITSNWLITRLGRKRRGTQQS